jgi:hypothetical protein
MDEPQEYQVATPDTATERQPEASGEAAEETQYEIASLSASETEKRVSFTTDDQPSDLNDNNQQEDSGSPTQETDDALSAAQSKKEKKKKRQSVTFAEPLEEHLGSSTKARGEDDSKQKAKDSKDSVSEVPTVPPQSGDSVDEQPAQSEAQSPSAQVGVTVPLPAERDVLEPGFNLDSQQEPTEPPASRSLDQAAETEIEPKVESQQLKPQPETGSKEVSDESKSRRKTNV